jgi:putative addiction module killer protein
MYKVRYTAVYRIWHKGLKDKRAKFRIGLRLNALKKGDFGAQRSLESGIFELKQESGQ